jgi:NDP-sugar pyrophosphorylase family protein
VRRESAEMYALNGDELVDVDFAALLACHRAADAAATVAVAQPKSPFGVVELGPGDLVEGFTEGGRIPYWVNCGIYVFSPEAIERLPPVGDHETTTFPELVRERRLQAYRHEGLWLTVNTPKELRVAGEHVAAHPEWLA